MFIRTLEFLVECIEHRHDLMDTKTESDYMPSIIL